MPFCTGCGSKLEPTHKFCNNCGTPAKGQSTNTPPPPPPQHKGPQSPSETVISSITGLKKMKRFGMSDAFFLTASSQRVVISPLTSEMLNRSTQSARDNAKNQGKGFFGQWKAQMGSSLDYAGMYIGKTPDQVISENPGSIFISLNSINRVRFISRNEYPGDDSRTYYEFEIQSGQGHWEYRLDSSNNVKEFLDLFPGRVDSNVHFF